MARLTSRRWFPLVWALPAALVVLLIAVLVARALRADEGWATFFVDYPGEVPLPDWAPVGFPAWLSWQHGLNGFLLLFIVRSGWLIRGKQRPPAFVTRDNTRFPRTAEPPTRMSIHVWWHLVVDSLWALNGVVYFVLLFATGQWVRLVPIDWAVVPNAVSAGIQYLSLDWPTHHGWVNYNSLQVLAYFVTVFIAGPLAFITGLRMSPIWPTNERLNRAFPIEWARKVHYPVMLYFVVFVIVHVTLVLATGAMRNLNHMYAASNEISWVGVALFAGSVVLMAVAVLAARPVLLRPIAGLTGKLSR